MKTLVWAVCIGAALGVACQDKSDGTSKSSASADADNTKKNERDRSDATKTPGDQQENEADRKTTQAIRKDVMGKSDLSINAKNVKIITKDGVVTLRGPVDSASEKETIQKIAENTAGAKSVDNQLEVRAN